MSTYDSGLMALKLKGCGADFSVLSMVLYGEMNHLPFLLIVATPDQSLDMAAAPLVHAGPYTLVLENGGSTATPFGVSNWFVQAVSSFTQSPHESAFCLRLGALSGQHLPMQGYATDAQPLSAVLQNICNRFLGQRLVKNVFTADDPVVGAVVSFNETMGHFLARMALACDTWLWAEEKGTGDLTLQWQATLQGTQTTSSFDDIDWPAALVAKEHSAAVSATRTFWPRSSVKQAIAPQSSSQLFTREVINLLPVPFEVNQKTDSSNPTWETGYYLSDNIAHAAAWPGLRTGESQVLVGVIHVYDQSASGDVRRLLGQLVPGIREAAPLSTLASDAAYGVFAVCTESGQKHAGVAGELMRLQLEKQAARIGAALGIPAQKSGDTQAFSPNVVLATVCPWDPSSSATWAAGAMEGSEHQTTFIKVCFDWSEVPVRVPYAYPMSGREGVVFCPPAAGDRVIVLLERMWPVVAYAAYQSDHVLLPGVLRSGADADTLSAQRGMVVKGGLIFRTADSGDLVIHAAGNLVLRAEKDIFLDGQHLREHGRAASGIDDAARKE